MNENNVDAFGLPPITHNLPDPIAALRIELEEAEAPLLARRDELLAASHRVPETVEDEAIAGRVADYIKLVMACHKNAEAARVARKEPHLAAGRAVDGFFKQITDPLMDIKKSAEVRLTAYQRKKADAERRARAEAERVAREAAVKAAEEARKAEEAMRNEVDLDAAIQAQKRAEQAEADRVAAERAAQAKAAELSRSRGDLGSVASLRTFWDFADLDRATVDLELLRQHLPTAALESAIRSYIKAGGRELRGVRIFENTSTSVR